MSQVKYSQQLVVGVQASAAGVPLIRIPAGYGGWTITAAYLVHDAAATLTAYLVDMGTALGTAQSATLGTSAVANGTFVANVQKALSLVADPYIAEEHWLGLHVTAGAAVAGSKVAIEYAIGQ